jgi:FKBP-type peptidyl-prolyl cis-trans isomerase SlyD
MNADTDTVVTFHYRLSDENNRAIEDSHGGDPLVFLFGRGAIIDGLEKAIQGRDQGDRFEVTVAPRDGYGLYREGLKQRIPIKHLRLNKKARLQPGQIVTLETRDGHRQVTVLKVGKFNVDVDGNHPLAGKTLNFEIEIVDVRAASPEEIAHGHVHGPGGHHH